MIFVSFYVSFSLYPLPSGLAIPTSFRKRQQIAKSNKSFFRNFIGIFVKLVSTYTFKPQISILKESKELSNVHRFWETLSKPCFHRYAKLKWQLWRVCCKSNQRQQQYILRASFIMHFMNLPTQFPTLFFVEIKEREIGWMARHFYSICEMLW